MINELETFIDGVLGNEIVEAGSRLLFGEIDLAIDFFHDFESDFWIEFLDDIDITIASELESIGQCTLRDGEDTHELTHTTRSIKFGRIDIDHITDDDNARILKCEETICRDGSDIICEKYTSFVNPTSLFSDGRHEKSYDLFTSEIEILGHNKSVGVFEDIIKTAHLRTIHTEMLIDDIDEKCLELINITGTCWVYFEVFGDRSGRENRTLKWTRRINTIRIYDTVDSSAIDRELDLAKLLRISKFFIEIMICESMSPESNQYNEK